MSIKAPFNFAPISKPKVVEVDWWDQITHDIPFEDSESACISLKIIAESPLYVRNGSSRKDQGNETEAHLRFSSHNGRYFIPGSSIKGAIRNVMEIISYSAMRAIDDHQYAYRDFDDSQNDYLSGFREHPQSCGWLLCNEEGNWEIEDCGLPGRIELSEVDKCLGSHSNLEEYFRGGKANFKKDSEKTAIRKHEIAGSPSLDELSFVFEETEHSGCFQQAFSNGRRGTIILTGQPSPKKRKDFIIFEEDNGFVSVPKQVQTDFRFAYHEGEPDKESKDWKHWRKFLSQGERVPVFFRRKKGTREVQDMGLTYMYKLAYKLRTSECIPSNHKNSSSQDMVRGLLGHIEKNNALRGRIQFSHAFVLGQPKETGTKKEVLSGPKASFYPMYLDQKGDKGGRVSKHISYNTQGARIRGWKRYPIHSGSRVNSNRPEGAVSEKIFTRFKPLDAGTTFEGRIRIHNLRKSEIGALLSALTFHNTPDCFHSLGMAKPLGYGKIKLELSGLEGFNYSLEEYLREFELFLGLAENSVEEWDKQPQITELFTMATEQKNSGRSELSYMTLDEYVEVKKRSSKSYLGVYSELPGVIKKNPAVIVSNEELESIKSKIDAAKLDELHKAEEMEKASKEKEAQDNADKLRREQQDRRIRVEKQGIFGGTTANLNNAVKEIKKYQKVVKRALNQEEIDEVKNKFLSLAKSNRRYYSQLSENRKKSRLWQDLCPCILSYEFISELQEEIEQQ